MPNTINYNVLRERYLQAYGVASTLTTTVIMQLWSATEAVHGKSRGPNREAINEARVAATLEVMFKTTTVVKPCAVISCPHCGKKIALDREAPQCADLVCPISAPLVQNEGTAH